MSAPEQDRRALRDLIDNSVTALNTLSGAAGLLRLVAHRMREKDRRKAFGTERRDPLPAASPEELELIADALLGQEENLSEDIFGVAKQEGIPCPPELDRDYTPASLRAMRV